ncbi:MAG TPA: hypothetical protein VGB86_02425 [Methylomirabilota bacterium]|jgi:hypothetical protein
MHAAAAIVTLLSAVETRRELRPGLDEKAPSNRADWTPKDSPEARRRLAALPGRS